MLGFLVSFFLKGGFYIVQRNMHRTTIQTNIKEANIPIIGAQKKNRLRNY